MEDRIADMDLVILKLVRALVQIVPKTPDIDDDGRSENSFRK